MIHATIDADNITHRGQKYENFNTIMRLMSDIKNSISIINLTEIYTDCTLCGKSTVLRWSIPMYEGKKVDTDKSDEWAGMPVCEGCYNKDLYYEL